MPYDVAISFAGEDRKHADELAQALQQRDIKPFYDRYAKAELWGKDLYSHLIDVYQNQARYCVMLLSANYAAKLWTNHERKAAQARAFREHDEYILPIRLDDTEIPGILSTTSYLSWPPDDAVSTADIIHKKLRKIPAKTKTAESCIAPTDICVTHNNKFNYKAAEVSFRLDKKHIIKREYIGGVLTSVFTLYVDGAVMHKRELKTFGMDGFEFAFKVENVLCVASYSWISGVFWGTLRVGGQRLL